MAAGPFVNAAGLVEQSALVATLLVMLLMAIAQETVPAVMLPADTLMTFGCTSETVAAQPAPVTLAVAPSGNRNPTGNVSVNETPLCTGLPTAFVIKKLSAVLDPAMMLAAAKLLVSVTGPPTIAATEFEFVVCNTAPTCCELAAVF